MEFITTKGSIVLISLALMSGVERIPRGTRRNKTGQENNPREKVRETGLERNICPGRKKECGVNWFRRKQEKSGNLGVSGRSFHP